MALIDCPECGKEVSDKAPSCPHCGIVFKPRENPVSLDTFEESKTEKISGVVWGVLKFILFLLVSGVISFAIYLVPALPIYLLFYEASDGAMDDVIVFIISVPAVIIGFFAGWYFMYRREKFLKFFRRIKRSN